MPDPQVLANTVQEAQAVLQNPAPDEAQAPAVQAPTPAQAKFFWRFVKLYFLCPLSRVSFWFSSVLFSVSVLRFCLFLSALFYFYRFPGLLCFERFALHGNMAATHANCATFWT